MLEHDNRQSDEEGRWGGSPLLDLTSRWIVAALLLSLVACRPAGKLREGVAELRAIQSRVGELARTEEVSIVVTNGEQLDIGITNSPVEASQPTAKREKALECARVAYAGIADRSSIKLATVSFGVGRTYLGFIRSSTITATFRFDENDLVQGIPNAPLERIPDDP